MKSSKKVIQSVVAVAIVASGASKAQAGGVDFVKAHPVVAAVAGVGVAGAAMVSVSYAYDLPPTGCQFLPTLEMGVCEVARSGLGVRAIGCGAFASVVAAGKKFFSEDVCVSEKFNTLLDQGQSVVEKYLGWASGYYASAPVVVRWIFEGKAKGAVVKAFERISGGGLKWVRSFFKNDS